MERKKITSQFHQRLIMGTVFLTVFTLALCFAAFPAVAFFLGVAFIYLAYFAWKEAVRLLGHEDDIQEAILQEKVIMMAYLSYHLFCSVFLPTLLFFPLVFIAAMLCSFFSLSSHYLIPSRQITATLFKWIYLILPFALSLELLFRPLAPSMFIKWELLYLIFVVKSMDIGGYFIGRKWGKHAIAPHISPKKTWEGLFGGIALLLLTNAFFFWALPQPPIAHLLSFSCFGLCLGILGYVSDLTISILKRNANVKDSGVLPGLGGVLDMLDSLILPLFFFYFYLTHYSL